MATRLASPGRRIGAIFQVAPGEGRLVLGLVSFSFALGFAFVLIQTAGFALFLEAFAPEQLPFVYLGNAVVISLIAVGYLRLADRLALPRLLAVTVGALLIGSIALRLGLETPIGRWVAFGLPIWFQVTVQLGNLVFWTLAGRLFDVRQSKRLFGVVGAGNWLATISGGLLTPLMVALGGTANLLWFAVAALVAALALLQRLTSGRGAQLGTGSAGAVGAEAPPAARGYIGLIFALVGCWWLGFFVLDNAFYLRASAQLSNATELAAFLGLLFAGQGLLALFTSSFLTGRLLGRFGLKAGLLIMPALLIAIVAPMAIGGSLGAAPALLFGLAALSKLVNVALGFSLEQAGLVVLYQPLRPSLRLRVQALAETVAQPLATGVAGLLLLFAQRVLALDATSLGYLYLLIAVAWIATAVALVRRYPRAVAGALARRHFSPEPVGPARLESAGHLDASTRALLLRELGRPQAAAALFALTTLERADPAAVAAALPTLAGHPAPEVRRAALAYGAAGGPAAQAELARRLADDPAPLVRADALSLLVGADGLDLALLEDALDSRDSAIRRAALVALLRLGGAAHPGAAAALARLLAAPEAGERALAATVIGEAGIPASAEVLTELLNDPAVKVRRAALVAVAGARVQSLWPEVVAALADGPTASAAMAALVAGAPAAAPAIATALSDPSTPRAARRRLLAAVGQGAAAPQLALDRLADPDDDLRGAALAALVARGARLDGAQLARGLQTEAARAELLTAAAAATAASQLLATVLAEELAGLRRRALDLLALAGDRAVVERAWHAARAGVVEQRAYGIEVIEGLLPPAARPALLPLFDQRTGGGPARPTATGRAALAALAHGPAALAEPWARACAVAALGSDPVEVEARVAAHADPDPLVREAARDTGPADATDRPSLFERVALLKGSSVFSAARTATLAEVASLLEPVALPAGASLFTQGDHGDSLYIVAQGRLRIHLGAQTVQEHGPGAVIGEMALIDAAPRTASATALSATLLLRLDQEPFYALLEEHGEVARGVLAQIAGRLRAVLLELATARLARPEEGLSHA